MARGGESRHIDVVFADEGLDLPGAPARVLGWVSWVGWYRPSILDEFFALAHCSTAPLPIWDR